MRTRFGANFDNVFAHLDKPTKETGQKDGRVDTLDELRGLLFTNIMTPAGSEKRPYEEILEFLTLQESCNKILEDYNVFSEKPMELVLFNFAIEHLLVISRILT